jgi:hypothetical protein
MLSLALATLLVAPAFRMMTATMAAKKAATTMKRRHESMA